MEFAILLPIFLVLTLGVVDGARMFSSYIALENGVREAALYASQAKMQADTTGIRAKLDAELTGIDTSQVAMTVSCDGAVCASGTYTNVNVTATYQMHLFFTTLGGAGGIGAFWPSALQMRASTTARVIPYP